jgi:hypothetical protein
MAFKMSSFAAILLCILPVAAISQAKSDERCPTPTDAPDKPLNTPPPLIGNLKMEQVVIDPAWTAVNPMAQLVPPFSPQNCKEPKGLDWPRCWQGPSLARRDEWEIRNNVSFYHYTSVESFVGGKVKSVRIVAYDPARTPAQIKEEFRKVWFGVFRDTSCFIVWDEITLWNLRAVIEFEDGKQISLLTDGMHVEVQDREGKYWYMREWPAVD